MLKQSIALSVLCVLLASGPALAEKDGHDHGHKEHAHKEHGHKDHGHEEEHAEDHRHVDAHEHGVSVLNAALEGEEFEMELEAPGADIVGFEHEATSAEDKAAVEAALASLRAPAALFTLPAAAECEPEEIEVELHGGGGEHNEFHAHYRFHCHAPEALTAIEFPFFARFPNAAEIELKLITEKGQSAYEIERDAPKVDLSGAI